MACRRIFLLSPARCGGRRSELLFNERAGFDLALHFATRRAHRWERCSAFSVACISAGNWRTPAAFHKLLKAWSAHTPLPPTAGCYRSILPSLWVTSAFSATWTSRRRHPLQRAAGAYRPRVGSTGRKQRNRPARQRRLRKICGCALETFGSWLTFPSEFVGRGDMSRGGLMLRCVDEGRELAYIPVVGAVRNGKHRRSWRDGWSPFRCGRKGGASHLVARASRPCGLLSTGETPVPQGTKRSPSGRGETRAPS